jgi:hypothetical protein
MREFYRQNQHYVRNCRQHGTDVIARVGLETTTAAKSIAGVELGTAPAGSGGGIDRVGVDGVVASLDLSGGKASEGRGGKEDGGVEHVCNEDLHRLKR